MDALPFVAAWHQIAIRRKHALFLLGDMLAEPGYINPSFPFLRHIHHAGTVQVIVPQLAGGLHIRQMHKVVHVVGVVDDLPDIFKAAPWILQGGVQLRKGGSIQRVQPCGKEIQFVHVGGQHHVIGNSKVPVLRVGKSGNKKSCGLSVLIWISRMASCNFSAVVGKSSQ